MCLKTDVKVPTVSFKQEKMGKCTYNKLQARKDGKEKIIPQNPLKNQ
jgi:hypothetical protein